VFRQNENTAASNKLPLGTDVKVTNLKNGKSADVTVTDHGAKLGNHKIDLSKKAANEIGLTLHIHLSTVYRFLRESQHSSVQKWTLLCAHEI
jgi:rare lipoprotein A